MSSTMPEQIEIRLRSGVERDIPFGYCFELGRLVVEYLGHRYDDNSYSFGQLTGLSFNTYNLRMEADKDMRWQIRTSSPELTSEIVWALEEAAFEAPYWCLVKELRVSQAPDYSHAGETYRLFMETPVVLMCEADEWADKYALYGDDDADRLLTSAVRRALSRHGGAEYCEDVDAWFDRSYAKAKTRVMHLRDEDDPKAQPRLSVQGSLCPVVISAPEHARNHALQTLWACGIGDRTYDGFGFVHKS